MPIPPEPVLRAALRWLEHLPASGAARTRALFTAHGEFSDITPTQYDTAYAWLRDSKLLDGTHRAIPVQWRIFDAAVAGGATWFPDADLLLRSADELPEDALRAAEALGLSEGQAFTRIGAVWGKVDTAERARIGAAGERAIVDLLARATDAEVEHVAAWSDGYGFDVAVRRQGFAVHLEVKSTVRRGRLTVYLSRHEYETMLSDPLWQMIAVRLTADLRLVALATVPRQWIAGQVPADRAASGRWESCRLEVPPDVPEPGIPALSPVLSGREPAVLRGFPAWPGERSIP